MNDAKLLPNQKPHRLLLLALFAAMAGSGASATASPAPAPNIKFAEPIHDFGRLRDGTYIHHEYLFTNSGNAGLVISNVVPSCGCSTTPEWTREVPPGGQGTIPLIFDSTGMLGPIQRTLAIHSNDPEQPVVVLTFASTVWKPVELHPAVAIIHMPPRTTHRLSTTVRIVNQTDKPLKLSPPSSTLEQLEARIVEVTPGKEYHLILDMDAPAVHQDLNATVTFKTSAEEDPEIVLPVFVFAEPEILVTPNSLFLPAVPPEEPEPYVISVRNQSPDPITIEHAACDAPGAKVDVREIQPGRDFELAVLFPADFGYIENQTFSITARTSHPDHPEIVVHIAFAQPPTPNQGRRR